MDRLTRLEHRSLTLIREAISTARNPGILWSIGKDSTAMLWLIRKAYLGTLPAPVLHVDTRYKFPEMIQFRNELARSWGFTLVTAENSEALNAKETFPDGNANRLTCCRNLKTEGLKGMIQGTLPRRVLDLSSGSFVRYENTDPFTTLFVAIRSDEEGTRSKERYFSPRSGTNTWNLDDQPPELWGYVNHDTPGARHVRVHPLLDWSERDVWDYIDREKIPLVKLYFDQGKGERYRSIGCFPCTFAVKSSASTVGQIVDELGSGLLAGTSERSGRAQDKDDEGGLETLRKDGYM